MVAPVRASPGSHIDQPYRTRFLSPNQDSYLKSKPFPRLQLLQNPFEVTAED